MKSVALSCLSCGEALKVPKDMETLACTRCGMQLTVERGKGYVSLKIRGETNQQIEVDTKAQDRAAAELAIIRLNQELGLLGAEKESLEEKIKEVERRIHEKRRRTGARPVAVVALLIAILFSCLWLTLKDYNEFAYIGVVFLGGIALVLFIDNLRRAFSRSRIEQQQGALQEELAAKEEEIADKLQELKHHISKL
jgi:DNA-directed RNA polymerase subunit RPC12/RpoP